MSANIYFVIGGMYMSVQSEFIGFHGRIKLDYDVRSELASKRDILIDKLRRSGKLPGFTEFNQGSYGMYLGVEPIDGKEYDIDVGLRFNVNKADYDPMDLKDTICEVLKNHTEYGAKIKKPCVTVTYKKDGEPSYHVDLVVYVYEDKQDSSSQLFLARGINAESEETCWEKSDPLGLIDYINDAVAQGDERDQFRRVVRYLKRWRNRRFSSTGHSEPASIGITLIAADYFKSVSNDDLAALKNLVDDMLALFVIKTYEDGRWLYRITYPMPASLDFESGTDAFNKMTDIQMTDFKDKLDKLSRDLADVQKEPDEVEQCKKLNKIFGDDFHVPEAKNVSKKQSTYIPSSSASGAL